MKTHSGFRALCLLAVLLLTDCHAAQRKAEFSGQGRDRTYDSNSGGFTFKMVRLLNQNISVTQAARPSDYYFTAAYSASRRTVKREGFTTPAQSMFYPALIRNEFTATFRQFRQFPQYCASLHENQFLKRFRKCDLAVRRKKSVRVLPPHSGDTTQAKAQPHPDPDYTELPVLASDAQSTPASTTNPTAKPEIATADPGNSRLRAWLQGNDKSINTTDALPLLKNYLAQQLSVDQGDLKVNQFVTLIQTVGDTEPAYRSALVDNFILANRESKKRKNNEKTDKAKSFLKNMATFYTKLSIADSHSRNSANNIQDALEESHNLQAAVTALEKISISICDDGKSPDIAHHARMATVRFAVKRAENLYKNLSSLKKKNNGKNSPDLVNAMKWTKFYISSVKKAVEENNGYVKRGNRQIAMEKLWTKHRDSTDPNIRAGSCHAQVMFEKLTRSLDKLKNARSNVV